MPSTYQSFTPFIVPAYGDRRGDQHVIGADTCMIKVSASDTDGAFALLEYIGRTEGGPPLHVHPNQDEIFFVQEGRYQFRCGDEVQALGAGDTIFLPRDIPHAFRQTSSTGRLLFMFTPAGDMEAFFAELAAVDGVPTPAVAAALFSSHGMAIVGPPLDTD